jgi:Phasin protein
LIGFSGTAWGWEEKMANRYQRGAYHGPVVPISLNTAFTAWSSLLTGALGTAAVGQLGSIADEWQDFVSRRLKEDVAFLQRISQSAAPDQIIAAYAEFWRKAVEDYGNEIATMTKLMTDASSKMAVAAQSVTEEASTKLFHREAA